MLKLVLAMKVLLQNVTTGLFLKGLEDWTEDSTKARQFPNSLSALSFCNLNDIKDVQVLLRFNQPRYDVKLSLVA